MAAPQEAPQLYDYTASSREGRTPIRTAEEMREIMPILIPLSRATVREVPGIHEIYDDFLGHLEQGTLRAAEPQPDGTWVTDQDVRRFISVGFRIGDIIEISPPGAAIPVYDRHTLPPQQVPDYESRVVRTIATGSARRGSHLGDKVTIMNGGYVNVGAYVGEGTMVDSNALVGSAAQIGERSHLSAGVVIAGVLEPAGQHPVSVGDDVFVGAGAVLAEGTVIGNGTAIDAGTIIHHRTPLFDAVTGEDIKPINGRIYVPANVLVIPAFIPSELPTARDRGISVRGAMIVKHYDPSVEKSARTAINYDLR